MKKSQWEEAAECLRTLSHPHRLKMIKLLLEEDHTVKELATECGILQNVASEHLTLMKNKGFISAHKEGRSVHYKVAEPALSSILACVRARFFPDKKEKK